MKSVDTIARIRREFFVRGRSIKEIARELHVARNTVRKVLRSGETIFSSSRETQPLPKLGPWMTELDGLLAANAASSARERLTLVRLFEELRGRGYEGGYDAVRRYARVWALETSAAKVDAYVPLSFAPGEAGPFDCSHEAVPMNGPPMTVKVAQVRLCHSRMMFARAYPRESQEPRHRARTDGATMARCSMPTTGPSPSSGAPARTASSTVRWTRKRSARTDRASRFGPARRLRPGRRGRWRIRSGRSRERFFTPRLRVRSFDELNALLLARCIAYAEAHRTPEFPDLTIWKAFEAERASLVPHHGPFDGFHAVTASAS